MEKKSERRRLNWDFQGGFGGVAHRAREGSEDTRLSPEARQRFADARDFARAAFAAEKVGDTDKATWCAVQATKLVSEATQSFALGWVGDAESKT